MFTSPFKDDMAECSSAYNCQPQQFNNVQFQQQAQPQVQPKQAMQADDLTNILNNLKPQQMANPVRITEPSYILTETQLQQLVGVVQCNPDIKLSLPQQTQAQPYTHPSQFQAQPQAQVITPQEYQLMQKQQQVQPVQQASESKSWFDELGNITFGTVGRIGHTLTTVADGVIDILTLGYSKRG